MKPALWLGLGLVAVAGIVWIRNKNATAAAEAEAEAQEANKATGADFSGFMPPSSMPTGPQIMPGQKPPTNGEGTARVRLPTVTSQRTRAGTRIQEP